MLATSMTRSPVRSSVVRLLIMGGVPWWGCQPRPFSIGQPAFNSSADLARRPSDRIPVRRSIIWQYADSHLSCLFTENSRSMSWLVREANGVRRGRFKQEHPIKPHRHRFVVAKRRTRPAKLKTQCNTAASTEHDLLQTRRRPMPAKLALELRFSRTFSGLTPRPYCWRAKLRYIKAGPQIRYNA